MRRGVRGLVLAGGCAVLTAAAMVGAGMEGWHYGMNLAPSPSGCGCFDPVAAGERPEQAGQEGDTGADWIETAAAGQAGGMV